MAESGTKGSEERQWRHLHLWQIQAVRDLLVIAAVVVLIWLGYQMRAVTTPLLVALGLAYLFEPLVVWLTKRLRIGRPIAVTTILCVLGIVVLVTAVITIPLAIGQTARLVDDLRGGRYANAVRTVDGLVPEQVRGDFRRATQWMGLVPNWESGTGSGADGTEAADGDETADAAPDGGTGTEPSETSGEMDVAVAPTGEAGGATGAPNEATAALDEQVRRIVREELAASSTANGPDGQGAIPWVLVRRTIDAVWSVLGAGVKFGLLAFLIPFYFFFFSVSYPQVVKFAEGLLPTENRPRIVELIRRMDRAVAGFVRGRIGICLVLGVLFAVGWTLCGVPYAIVLGLVVGIFNLVPYLSGIGWPVAVLLLAMDQLASPAEARMSWLWILMGPSIVFLMVSLLDGYVFMPIFCGKATDLDPVTIVVAVLAGGAIGGLYGMLLAVPAAACMKILLRDVLMPRLRAWSQGRASDPLPLSKE